jgi:TPR repeat protein/transglutaminase-like putative cysteine protease
MRLSMFVLLAAIASSNALAARAVPVKGAIARTDATFTRGTPLPKWAQPLAEIPATERTDPVVTRLSDVQAKAGANPAVLVNHALQVNDPAALSEIGQYALSYFPSYQKVQLHRVAIIRAGQVMDRTAAVNVRLLEREQGVEAGVYGGEKSVQLLLDDVRAGDTLWITYSIDGQNPVFGKRWASIFSWDRPSPVELRRLTVLHPTSQRIYWRQLGDIKAGAIEPTIDRVGDMERMRFEGRSLEAVQFEPSIPPDFMPVRRLQMSEYPDWQVVAGWADGLFPRAPASPALKQLAARFAMEGSRLAQASAALHWVQDEIRYFSVSIGENSHRPQAPDTVLARRYGDCKDKTYLLVSLLGQLGISAQPVLVTASAPKLPGKLIPTPTMFDHVIVRVELDGAVYYVDPTRTGQKGLLTGLPAVLPGAAGLVVAADTRALIALPEDGDQSPLLEYIENIGIASFDGDATLESRMVYRGEYADWARRRYPVMAAATLKKVLLERYEKGYPGVTLVAAPKLVDDADGARFEVVANYTLPKPVKLENGRYSIAYDSQILEDTVTTPAKVVRSFPYRLPQGKFRGRYRLNLSWPERARISDPPIMKTLDNPFFLASEEYLLSGNRVGYMLDFRLKADQVAADAMQEFSAQAKKLNPFASGSWLVRETSLAAPTALGYSFRTFESYIDAQFIEAEAERISAAKGSAVDIGELCEFSIRVVQLREVLDVSERSELSALSQEMGKIDKIGGVRRCRARMLFAEGRFAESVPLFEAESALTDDDALVPALAWARFHAGDGKGALADIERYRNARVKSGELTGLDIADAVALLRRLAQPVPAALLAYGREVPDGPWPRPLVAMQAGVISEAELVRVASALPRDTREMALNDAWFFIGQHRLAAQDRAGAEQAFRWFAGNGLRRSRVYPLARYELAQYEVKDAGYLAGMRAAARKDYAEAASKWQDAAGRGLAPAKFELALLYFHGNGVKHDYGEAMRLARAAAEQGVPGAMNLVGSLYLDGKGVPRDTVTAFEWHRRAAEQFDMSGLHNMASYYLKGIAPAQADPAKALGYMLQSAELGDTQHQAALAAMYTFGRGTAVDYTQALHWAENASRRGNNEGRLRLAHLYSQGLGVKKAPERALELIRQAADAGDGEGLIALGYAYEKGDGVAQDVKAAFKYFEKAAEQGHPRAELMLGQRYRDGENVTADPAKALMWLERAAAHGYAPANSYLAETFINGIGVPKDRLRGVGYLRGCAAAGEPVCQQGLGLALHFGKGVDKDYAAAAEWYRKAADQGMELSRNNLADLYENGFGVPQDFGRAVSLYRQAGSAGHPMGFVSLGSMYERGTGVAANPQTAYTYFQIALRMMGGTDKNGDTAQRRDKLAGQLNATQLAQADAAAVAWKPGSPFPGDPIR